MVFRRYALYMFGLEQIVTKPTRVTRTSRTLIDHIITNYPMRISATDVIPTSIVSDHDALFACINVRVNRYQPRYKYIRNMKTFDEQEFISDLNTLPLNIVYSSDDPEEQLDRQHPGWTTAKYGHYNSCGINSGRKPTRLALRSPGSLFRDVRNKLKAAIRRARETFRRQALSSNKPKEVWRIINQQPLLVLPRELYLLVVTYLSVLKN